MNALLIMVDVQRMHSVPTSLEELEHVLVILATLAMDLLVQVKY